MLNSTNLNNKNYEDVFAEAMSQISVYSKEWTNFNVSDPGITILQNLSAFNLLQQTYINEVNDPIRRKLLKLLGFEAKDNCSAHVFLQAKTQEPISLLAHKKLMAGGVCFETTKPVRLGLWDINAMYMCRANVKSGAFEEYNDVTYLLDGSHPVGTAVFGLNPQPGMAVCCIFSDLPRQKDPIPLWIQVHGDDKRNPIDSRFPVQFAKIKWQCYTASGWKDIKFRDKTNGFLNSGAIWINLPEGDMIPFTQTPQEGYAIRFVLEKSSYDMPPRLSSISARLIQVIQCDTKSTCFSFAGGTKMELRSEIAKYGNFFVCCKEASDQPYRAYNPFTIKNTQGRLYTQSQRDDGPICIHFDKKNFGFGPYGGKDSVRIICYDDETIQNSCLGLVYGYENQIIDIDLLSNLLSDNFCLMVEETHNNDEKTYSFVYPGDNNPEHFCYTLLSGPGQICITHPGSKGGCKLYLCDCAITAGSAGNIREQNEFRPEEIPEQISNLKFINPSAGFGGTSYESAEQLRLRFVNTIKFPTAAVMASDYEFIVRETPGLCIKKVKAVTDLEKNTVKIAVMPCSEEQFPELTSTYENQILRYLEPHRMLTTKVKILQPKYVKIDVKATIYIKNYYDNSRKEVESKLRDELDFNKTGSDFGALICYNDIFHRLEELQCVDSVYELILSPQGRNDAKLVGTDIRLGNNCLSRVGIISLELNPSKGTSMQVR